MDNGIVGNAAMPRPMPLPTRPAVADSLAQDRDQSRAEASASRPDPDNPATTPAEPDPVPQTVSTQATSGETRDPFVDQLQGMAQEMTDRLQSQGRLLEFQVNGENNDNVVILIRASDTGEVVRTIPPDEMANLSRQVRDGDLSLVSIRA